MEERPAWRCRTEAEKAEFKEFVLEELALRMIELGATDFLEISSSIASPAPSDKRRKLYHERALDPVELGARAAMRVREIFEDYWQEGRPAGRQYRGHDPSVEEIAAEYAGVSIDKIRNRLKRARARRPIRK